MSVYHPGKVVDNVEKPTQVARAQCFVALYFLKAYLLLDVQNGQENKYLNLFLTSSLAYPQQSVSPCNRLQDVKHGITNIFWYVFSISLICLRYAIRMLSVRLLYAFSFLSACLHYAFSDSVPLVGIFGYVAANQSV